jgi:S-DNA-T family DNA segregation ATPase FtsK/SpoIIIE
MPNLLISGSTGSGISTCISSIVISLLMKYKPNELRLVIIDPKRIDFSSKNEEFIFSN